jgi:4-diphosphocytidyl-2-C-methyl-D-erythritol kinase
MPNEIKMQNEIKFLSPAKINLFFAVTGLRNDGYHSVFAANVALNFCDEMTVEDCGESSDKISCNAKFFNCKNNTIATAFDFFRKQTGIKKYFSVALQKRIPMEGGFGGGSSNGAAALSAANELCNCPLSSTELANLSGKIGADCPFFLSGGPSIATGIGDVCVALDCEIIEALDRYNLLIFKPKFGTRTGAAYGILREKFRHLYIGEEEAAQKFLLLKNAIVAGNGSLPLFNTFAQIFFAERGILATLRKNLSTIGANVMLTGSGSGGFCIYQNSAGDDAVEAAIKQQLGVDAFIKKVRILRQANIFFENFEKKA